MQLTSKLTTALLRISPLRQSRAATQAMLVEHVIKGFCVVGAGVGGGVGGLYIQHTLSSGAQF